MLTVIVMVIVLVLVIATVTVTVTVIVLVGKMGAASSRESGGGAWVHDAGDEAQRGAAAPQAA